MTAHKKKPWRDVTRRARGLRGWRWLTLECAHEVLRPQAINPKKVRCWQCP